MKTETAAPSPIQEGYEWIYGIKCLSTGSSDEIMRVRAVIPTYHNIMEISFTLSKFRRAKVLKKL
jgi:hypothetical protein